jgi:hypothetical protein
MEGSDSSSAAAIGAETLLGGSPSSTTPTDSENVSATRAIITMPPREEVPKIRSGTPCNRCGDLREKYWVVITYANGVIENVCHSCYLYITTRLS